VKSEEVQQQRCNFWQALKEVKAEDIVCIDETGIREGIERTVARSECGREVFSYRACYKGTKHSIIGAISTKGIVCLKMIKGAMKGEDFLAFIQEDLVPNLRPRQVVIMDNLTAHKVKGIEQAITQAGAEVLYLPPYSPDVNPIERLWSVLKYYLRLLRAYSLDLFLKIFHFLLEKSFFKNWFTKCCYCAT
jgi:transposase